MRSARPAAGPRAVEAGVGRAARLPFASLRCLRDSLLAARTDVAVVAAITALAAAIRVWHLGTVPLGLHGDEALTGLDARRVLREGWIGPYVISALGQPTGPLYFTALLFKFMPQTTFTLRFSMALFGIATIPLAYFAFASMFNRTVAAFAAFLLAVMTWHLHLSRTGFMVTSWPFIETAVLWALFAALHRRSALLLALAGALAGLGVYTYNAYLLFLPVIAVPLIWHFLRERSRRERLHFAAATGVLVCAALIVAIPMLQYVYDHGATYRYHDKQVGVTHSDEWRNAGLGGKVRILWDRGREWERGLVRGGRPDFGDGLAARGHPVVDAVTVVLAVIGVLFALPRWRRPEHAVVLAALLVLPLGTLLTTGDGLFRRTLGLAPFVAVLAAFPLAYAWQRALRAPDPGRYVFVAALGAVLAYVGVSNVRAYFGPVQNTDVVRYVFPYQDAAAAHYIARLPGATFVYFYSDRWGVDYETRQFIAPRAQGIDRSREFRGEDVPQDASLDFSVDRGHDVAFFFLGLYLDDLQIVVDRYPGGTVTEERRGGEVLFRAYHLPKE